MDSSYYIILIFIYGIGIFAAFSSAVFSELSAEDFKDMAEKQPEILIRIQKLKRKYTESHNPFFSLEMLSYLSGTSLLSVLLTSSNLWYDLLFIVPIVFFVILLLRTVSYALGSNLSEQTPLKLLSILRMFVALTFHLDKLLLLINQKISGKKEQETSLQELTALVDTVCEDGSLGFGEYTLLRNIIKFKEVYVSDIMTPRTVIFSCSADSTVRDVVNLPEIQMYSRFPLREGETLDNGVAGYAMSKDVFRAALAGKWDVKLRELARELHFVPENSGLEIALDLLLKQKQLLFLVVDEYGGIEGLLSMEDVIETMLGAEIVDEADKVADLREVAKLRRDKRIAFALSQNEN